MDQAHTEIAYAKINLALHIRRRRQDGFHDLETLFAFLDDGDHLSVRAGEAGSVCDQLAITGPFSAALCSDRDNLVLRAAETMRGLAHRRGITIPPLDICLEKNLPVAAGIGGGSADAAAMIRLIDRAYGLRIAPTALVQATTELGADVGACIVSETRLGVGLGWDLRPVVGNSVSGTPALLVNPGQACPTGQVFSGWDGMDRGPLNGAEWRSGRNDLTDAAIHLCPEIDDVMAVLRAQLPAVARMSGSGATCFALFEDSADARAAAARIADGHPEWWVMAGILR